VPRSRRRAELREYLEFVEEETGRYRADFGDWIDLLTDQGLHQRGREYAVRSELSTPFSLVLVGRPTGRGLRLHADELEAEIAQPVEESVEL
jgi:hypothetical protein